MPRKRDTNWLLKCVVAVCALVVVGAIAYYFFRQHPTATAQHKAGVQVVQTKTYCESASNSCFSYPAGWTKPAKSTVGYSVVATFGSPNHTLGGQYLFIPDSTNASSTFYTFSSQQLTTAGRQVYLIGGYFTAGSAAQDSKPTSPAYYLVDAAQVQHYGLGPNTSRPATTSLGINLPQDGLSGLAAVPAHNPPLMEQHGSTRAPPRHALLW